MRNEKCWANIRGDCSEKMSSEHLLSKNLFPEGKLHIQGYEWCKDYKLIGINSITRKILCERHNNELSPTDKEAKYAINSFAHGGTENRPINGKLFESWLIKTVINLSIGCEFHIGTGFTDSVIGKPSPYLVAVAYGEINLTHHMGMYLTETAENEPSTSEMFFMPIHRDGAIGAFLIGLRGVNIFLSLYPGHKPPKLSSLGDYDLPVKLADKEPIYRPSSITTFNLESHEEKVIEFKW